MKRQEIGASDVAPATGYAHGVELAGATRFLFLSGQVPVTVAGTVPAGIEAQTRKVWDNLLAHLAAAGMSADNLVKITVFLSDQRNRSAVNTVSDEILAGRMVAWTTVIAGLVRDDWLLEIEAIAAA